jgi:hypothetical protein
MTTRPGFLPVALCLFGLVFLSWIPAFAAVKDACSLITASDAQDALGEPVGSPRSEPRPSAAGDGTECKFRSTQGNAFRAKSVSLTVHYANSDISGSDAAISENLKSSGFKDVHSVSGVGDAAVWATNSMMGHPMGELTVRKGKSVMLIILITGVADEAAALDRAKALALKVLPKA